MSDRMSEDMPDRMPEDLPDRMPEDMPDRMPNRMSEDMSDRMPEDVPVRTCINVMVGITRSKVILFFWCLSMFGASSGLFFLVFFGACQCFCISHVKIMMKKVCFTRHLDPPNA